MVSRRLLPVLAAAALVLAASLALLAPARAADLAIVGARIYTAPDATPIESGTVLVRNGRIAAVGNAAQIKLPARTPVIDARGAVVTAGFWNSHVHLLSPPFHQPASRAAPELAAALVTVLTRWGFTTVFDIGSLPGDALAVRRRIASGEVAGPLILTTEAPFFPRDGTPIYLRELLQALRVPSLEVGDAAAGRARARAQLASGADGVKLMSGAIVGGPRGVLPMDAGIARAIAAEAHAARKLVFAHPSNAAGLDVAIAAGVDVLAHPTPTEGPWSDALAARLAAANIALTPTLTLMEDELARDGVPPAVIKRVLETGQQQVAAFVRAGGRLLFGTDVGYIERVDTRREFELMAGAGLDWRQILASLTTHPAERFGHAQRTGRIAAGMDADLVVLARDPATDPAAFAGVTYTIRGGRIIYRAPGAAGRAAP